MTSNLQTIMLKPSFCDYIDAYIILKWRIKITGAEAGAEARQAGGRNKGLIFKNCSPSINCKSEINNAEIDNAKDIDIVMPKYNLMEYSDN